MNEIKLSDKDIELISYCLTYCQANWEALSDEDFDQINNIIIRLEQY